MNETSVKKEKKLVSRKASRRNFIILFTVPTLILFVWFILYPIFQGLYYSFFNWTGLSSNMTFAGLDNYKKLIADPIVWTALWNDLKIAILRIAFTLIISLIFALMLTRTKVWANGFFRDVIFFPVVLSAVVICTMWMMMYNHNFGIINQILGVFGLSDPPAGWLGDKVTALYAIVPPAVWCSTGFYMIIFISAIETIPTELFESVKLDGANTWQETFGIILPLIKPQINFCVVYTAISSLNGSYQFVDLLTKGGPGNASEVLGTYMKLTGYEYHQFGYATTVAMVILAATALLSTVLNKIFDSEAYEF